MAIGLLVLLMLVLLEALPLLRAEDQGSEVATEGALSSGLLGKAGNILAP